MQEFKYKLQWLNIIVYANTRHQADSLVNERYPRSDVTYISSASVEFPIYIPQTQHARHFYNYITTNLEYVGELIKHRGETERHQCYAPKRLKSRAFSDLVAKQTSERKLDDSHFAAPWV